MFLVPVCFYLAWLLYYITFTIILCGDYIRRNGLATMTDNFFNKPFWENLVLDNVVRKSKLIRYLRLDSEKDR